MIQKYSLKILDNPSNEGKIEVKAPYSGDVIGQVEAASEASVDKALDTAYRLFQNKNKWLNPFERIAILEKTALIMEKRVDELALESAREGGKPFIDSKVEAMRAIEGVKACIETLKTKSGKEIPMNLTDASKNKIAFTHLEPIGVVVAVSAFNHPLNLIIHQVVPAVATGCPVIVKPAEDTPLSCFRFVEILHEAGLPEEWCQALVAKSIHVAEKLVTDKRVGFFSFIGSGKVGWMLRSKLAPGARCALEHGGAAPLLAFADADMKEMVAKILKGGFYHAGQVCVSVQRVFADEKIAAQLANDLASQAKNLIVGDPTDKTTQVGPLIRPQEVDRIESWVKEAVDAGAKILCGGKKISDFCYEPTVLFNPPANTKVSQMEIFGPVVCVYSCKDMNEAIHLANRVPFAFQASVFTNHLDEAMNAYKMLNASAIMINDHTAFRVDWMPFAGLRESGLGTGGIPHTMKDMQIEKMMVIHSKGL